ncbi:hypothetical protein [Nocardia bhagyanarayanae]|nr:hypothetical protein [Nocardia bhagyanarayanae]
MCKSVYDPCERGHDNWNGGGYGWDRRGDYDRCERERGPGWDRGWNNFFPFDLFGSS